MLIAVRQPRETGKCLWVDFGVEPMEMVVPLRLTTTSQPFGYTENGAKLSLQQRRDARVLFDKALMENASTVKDIFDHRLFCDAPSGPPRPFRNQTSRSALTAIKMNDVLHQWHVDRERWDGWLRRELVKIQTTLLTQTSNGFEQA